MGSESVATKVSFPDPTLKDLVKPHVEGFNYFLQEGLRASIKHIRPVIVPADHDKGFPRLELSIMKAEVGKCVTYNASNANDSKVFPAMCREMGISYAGQLVVTVKATVGQNGASEEFDVRMGEIPLMVQSAQCHLNGLNKQQLVQKGEEEHEVGGYFIMNGNERIVRLLVVPRRNKMISLIRPSQANKGEHFSQYGVQMRCARDDMSSRTITLHYLNTGTCQLRVTINKQEFFIPALLLLKSMVDASDRFIYEQLIQGETDNSFLCKRAEILVKDNSGKYSRRQIKHYLGKTFRVVLGLDYSGLKHEKVTDRLLDDHLFVHCSNNQEKFNCLIFMIRQLYGLAQGKYSGDNPDALDCHEVLLPGHLLTMIVKEKLEDSIIFAQKMIQKDINSFKKVSFTDNNFAYVKQMFTKMADVGEKVQYFFKTGNLVSRTGLDLQQTAGFTISADKLNYFRWLSHFRSIHRGQFFTQLRTTTVRKLLPESWGFLCPVHTPDGTPCGLLNHLALFCEIRTSSDLKTNTEINNFISVLCSIGMVPIDQAVILPSTKYSTIMLDGVVIGKIKTSISLQFTANLRQMKVKKYDHVPYTLEICEYLDSKGCSTFPAIYLYTTAARMVRPVIKLPSKEHPHEEIEFIGPSEQVVMGIACIADDYKQGETTHIELSPDSMLSLIASLTPFSDFNQSPRNMYQCQMGKQTMGTPMHAYPRRTDNTIYRIQTPQKPLVRNKMNNILPMDDYPLGTNAIVAVISYTGYDMEDAMILNKSSYERGFAHGSVYKSKRVNLDDYRKTGEDIHHHFSNTTTAEKTHVHATLLSPKKKSKKTDDTSAASADVYDARLSTDGLPYVGAPLNKDDPMYALFDDKKNETKATLHKGAEDTRIDEVRILNKKPQEKEVQHVQIKLRMNRNPVNGDKFASRHGQKGVLSVLWPQIDMPFTESGMNPDIIINPHAFPSRMTIGMLIESMAGKAAANHGLKYDSSPFQFNENDLAIDYFGKQLVQAGYNHYGTEVMYSGLTGVEMKAEIFIGVVYYQRLRHMVKDKFQVRSSGPVNNIHRQPVKGRKKHGGIRFGEMERDALLAHGCSFLLHDRLMGCSDYYTTNACAKCGSFISVATTHKPSYEVKQRPQVFCTNCKSGDECSTVAIPYVFLYLMNELAGMNIKISLDVQ